MRCETMAVLAMVAQKVRSDAEEASVEARIWKMKAGSVTRCTSFWAACIQSHSVVKKHIST